jgi:arsenate reductase-like glutaredoxin family protein
MKEIYFYSLANCTTCQKAKRRLDYHRITVTKYRDLKEEPLSTEEIKKLAKMLGGAENLFSRYLSGDFFRDRAKRFCLRRCGI